MPPIRRSISAILTLLLLFARLTELGVGCSSHHDESGGASHHASTVAADLPNSGTHADHGDVVAQATNPPATSETPFVTHRTADRDGQYDPPARCATAGMVCSTTAMVVRVQTPAAPQVSTSPAASAEGLLLGSLRLAPEPPPPRA